MLVLSVFVFTFLWDIDGWWLVWARPTQHSSLGHSQSEASQARPRALLEMPSFRAGIFPLSYSAIPINSVDNSRASLACKDYEFRFLMVKNNNRFYLGAKVMKTHF